MCHHPGFWVLVITAVFALSPVRLASAQVAREIGNELQLFVDDWLIESMHRTERVLHRPQAKEIAIQLDRHWEGTTLYDPSVLKDGDRYRMWYRTGGPGRPHLWGYAESTDGIHWVKPELGLIEYRGSTKNNLVWPVAGAPCSTLSVFIDGNPAAKPEERYKSIATGKDLTSSNDRPVIYGLVSPDGLRWRLVQKKHVIRPPADDAALDSHNLCLWDSARQQYAIYARGWYRRGGRPPEGEILKKELDQVTLKLPSGEVREVARIRDIRRFTSPDFINWSEPEYIQYEVEPKNHLYKNSAIPYFRRPDHILMFAKRFLPDRKFDPDWPDLYRDPPPNWPDCSEVKVPGTTQIYGCAGLSDILFMFSRDGLHFRRFQEAFIRPGLDRLNWHGRAIEVGPSLVPSGEGEMSLYYIENYGTPSVRIRRGALRTDGFVSLQADYQGGTVTTQPFTFAGSRLQLNYSTSAAGSIRVEVQDAAGKALPGLGLEDCLIIFGDELDRVVSWAKGSDFSEFEGQSVRLKFEIKDGDLFSMQFQ